MAYVATAQYAAARATLERARATNPSAEGTDAMIAFVTLLEGKAAEALELFRSAHKPPEERAGGEALALHALGRTAEAEEALARFTRAMADKHPATVASLQAWFGRKDEAFLWLERAYQSRDFGLNDLRNDALLKPLRGDARFAALLRRMNLPADS
jgi:hypothetical protein